MEAMFAHMEVLCISVVSQVEIECTQNSNVGTDIVIETTFYTQNKARKRIKATIITRGRARSQNKTKLYASGFSNIMQ